MILNRTQLVDFAMVNANVASRVTLLAERLSEAARVYDRADRLDLNSRDVLNAFTEALANLHEALDCQAATVDLLRGVLPAKRPVRVDA